MPNNKYHSSHLKFCVLDDLLSVLVIYLMSITHHLTY